MDRRRLTPESPTLGLDPHSGLVCPECGEPGEVFDGFLFYCHACDAGCETRMAHVVRGVAEEEE